MLWRDWCIERRLVQLLELRSRHAVDLLPPELPHEVLSLINRQRRHVITRPNHVRCQEDDQIELGVGSRVIRKEIAEHRNIRNKRDALARGIRLV